MDSNFIGFRWCDLDLLNLEFLTGSPAYGGLALDDFSNGIRHVSQSFSGGIDMGEGARADRGQVSFTVFYKQATPLASEKWIRYIRAMGMGYHIWT